MKYSYIDVYRKLKENASDGESKAQRIRPSLIINEESLIEVVNIHRNKKTSLILVSGFDCITNEEHLSRAVISLKIVLVMVSNWSLELKHVPVNFRRDIQIPLYRARIAQAS